MLSNLWRTTAVCTMLVVAFTAPAAADDFHYSSILIGDRASGMAGAYTAISDDVSGLYYNPAGAAYSTGRSLSASVNTYTHLNKKYDSVIGGNGWERNSSSILPNFFGIIQPVGSVKIGFSYAVPNSMDENQDQTFTNVPTKFTGVNATQYRINFNNTEYTYNYGPSIAYEINSKLSVGMTLYLHYRSAQTILNQLIFLSNGRTELTNQNYELHERGYKPILGIMWAPMDKMSVGLSVSKTFLTAGHSTTQTIFKGTTYPADQIDLTDSSSGEKRKYATNIRAGIAYFASPSLLLSLDGSYYTKVSDNTYGDKISLVNGAFGVEYYFDRNLALRAGVYTDRANTPELSSSYVNQAEHVNLNGVTLSISSFTRNTSVTLGGNYATGKGDAQVLSSSTSIQDLTEKGWSIYLSSSYSY